MAIIDLSQYDGPDKVVSVTDMQEILRESMKANVFKVRSKIPSLDKACGDFRGGELISISGPTKNGKSLLSQTLTKNFYEQNRLSLWFSFELPPAQFMDCFRNDLPLIYMPKILKAANMDWIEDRIMESFLKFNTRIIFLDHLHYLLDIARTKSPSIEIGTIIRRLKLIAVREGFLIFLMCHTGKPKRDDGEWNADDIRDSSFVGQESDAVFVVQRRPKHAQNLATCTVSFHRRTGVMNERIWMAKQHHGFLEETAFEEPEKKPKKHQWMND